MGLLEKIDGYIESNDDDSELTMNMLMDAGNSVAKHFTEEDADPEQLEMGIKVEMEHTSNKDISKKIALDHLAEIPDYYTRLRKMEEDAGVNVDEKIERYSQS